MVQLSVLDLIPVRRGQSNGQALASSFALAQVADRSNCIRYWVAEHHNTASVASTNPPVLIAMLASRTDQIRVGSGGVMLPNHAPLVVAEQFALLEAAYSGRIDLGIGRAPGSDPVTSWALRHDGDQEAVNRFPEYVDQVVAMMSEHGATIRLPRQEYALRATPSARSVAPIWLLGSSDYSARLAAEKGLPYVFAHHFSGSGTEQALALYREGFRPSEACPEPRTFLTMNVVVAPTQEEADRLALPNLLQMLSLRTGGPMLPQRLVEDAEAVDLPPEHEAVVQAMRARWVIGDPDAARARIAELAGRFGVDEVMVHPVAGALAGTPADASPARERTLELLTR